MIESGWHCLTRIEVTRDGGRCSGLGIQQRVLRLNVANVTCYRTGGSVHLKALHPGVANSDDVAVLVDLE